MTDKIYSIPEIKGIVTPIAQRYHLGKVFLFGSYARGSATGGSDIDLCVDASSLRGMFALGALYADLTEALRKELDLVTLNSLKYNEDREFLDHLERERVLIYDDLS